MYAPRGLAHCVRMPPLPPPTPTAPPPRTCAPESANPRSPRLLVEGSSPRFPAVYRRWLAASDEVDIALTRLRIATLRLEERDLARVERLRIVLAELSTAAWEAETHRVLLDPRRGPMLRRVIDLLREGRLQVRSAPLAGWAPDFTVFHQRSRTVGADALPPPRALLGPHWLEASAGLAGPRFAFEVHGADADRVSNRFGVIWDRGYDVGPAVTRLLASTMDTLDRLTPSIRQSIVFAPHDRGVLPP